MRIAALYDIHGNLHALEAVLDDVARLDVDRILIGGDVVPGPMPKETLSCLRRCPVPMEFIRGNGEVAVLREMEGADPEVPVQVRPSIRWNADQLSEIDREFLERRMNFDMSRDTSVPDRLMNPALLPPRSDSFRVRPRTLGSRCGRSLAEIFLTIFRLHPRRPRFEFYFPPKNFLKELKTLPGNEAAFCIEFPSLSANCIWSPP